MMTASTGETENIEKTTTAVVADETVCDFFLFFVSLTLPIKHNLTLASQPLKTESNTIVRFA